MNVAMALGVGDTYYVDASTPAGTGDGSLANPWTTITEAMAVATDGDTVNVAAGTYDAALGEAFPIMVPPAISLLGTSGLTTIDGGALGVLEYDGSGIGGVHGVNNLSGFTMTTTYGDAVYAADWVNSATATFNVSDLNLDSRLHINLNNYDYAQINVDDVTATEDINLYIDEIQFVGGITATNNTITDTGTLRVDVEFSDQISGVANINISGNTVSDNDGDGIYFTCSVSEDAINCEANIIVDNNTVTNANYEGIDFNVSFDDSDNSNIHFNIDITNNTITGSDYEGLDFSFEVESDTNIASADVNISGNTITNCDDDGMRIDFEVSDSSSSLDLVCVVDNNTCTGNADDGIEFELYLDNSTSAALNADVSITNNTLTDNHSDGIELEIDDDGGNLPGQEWNIRIDNNTITGNKYSGTVIELTGGATSSSSSTSSGNVTVNLDFGTMADNGSNVIHSNMTGSSSNTWSTTSGSIYQDASGIGMRTWIDKSWMPDIAAYGNDFGTTDPESVIVHQLDYAGLPLVEFTSENFYAPAAIYDAAETPMETAITVDVAANDSDLDGNMVVSSVAIVQSAAHGTVVNNGDGTVTYTPDAGWYGGDTIVYNISDSGGLVSNNATIGIMVSGTANTIPTANSDSAATVLGVDVIIDVLANDTDADGDALDVNTVTIHNLGRRGTATANADGTITYVPAASHQFALNTTDTFTYTVNDVNGGTSNMATVEVSLTLGVDAFR